MIKITRNHRCALCLAVCVACSSTPKPAPKYAPAQPVREAVQEVSAPPMAAPLAAPATAPLVVRSRLLMAPDPLQSPSVGQLKALPSDTKASAPQVPDKVIDAANRNAAQGPEQSGYFNAVMQYAYVPGALYQIYAAPNRITDISLQPGETVIGQPASGDTVRWFLGIGKSKEGGKTTTHVYLKPAFPGLHTNLAINTDRRTYTLELHSYVESYMAAVRWNYPQDEMAQLAARGAELEEERRTTTPVASVESLNFDYEVEIDDGEPDWVPVQVFDDGRQTFIRFPAGMLVREAPALFVLRDDQTQLVNYRVKGDLYIVDRLFKAATLRVGQKDPEIVNIYRTR